MNNVTATLLEPAPVTRQGDLARVRFQRSMDVGTQFFESRADSVASACLAMARHFRLGGRLLVFGTGAAATDAQHVSVEFVHPVLVGKRALPAIALTGDVSTLTAQRRGASNDAFGSVLTALGRRDDIAMAIATDDADPAMRNGLARARAMGMLTIALVPHSAAPLEPGAADFVFAVPSEDPLVVQEVHETLYHILWELVHVFLDHPASGVNEDPARA